LPTNLIQRFDLMQYYEEKYSSTARKTLGKHTEIIAGKDGIITIEVEDEDSKRAARTGPTLMWMNCSN